MTTVLIYMTKVAFYLAMFYLVYTLMLSSDTLHKRNRAFIILSVLAALLLPLITIRTNNPVNLPIFGRTFSEIVVYSTTNNSVTDNSGLSGIRIIRFIWIIYLSGLGFFGLKMTINILKLSYLIIIRRPTGSHIIRFQGLNTSGFSALGYIFLNTRLTTEEENEIIKHEQNHIDQNHFADIVFLELMCVVQWFNPFIHLFNRSLRAIHEFQADEVCLRNGITVCHYQNLLLNQVFRSNIFTLTNCFSNPTLIKKRMIMMTRKKSGALSNIKLLLVIPAVAFMLYVFSSSIEGQAEQMINSENTAILSVPVTFQPDVSVLPALAQYTKAVEITPLPPPPSQSQQQASIKTEPKTETLFEESPLFSLSEPEPEISDLIETLPEVFVIAEEMPSFPGGDVAMMNFIYKNIRYPVRAKEEYVQGRVFLRFCVTSNGTINQLSVMKGVDPILDAEAMRVVSMLPQWIPGKQGGKPVNVWFQLPITFQLRS